MDVEIGIRNDWKYFNSSVIAVLQGLMSSEAELVQGVTRRHDRFGTS